MNELNEWNNNIRVIEDETSVEIGKAVERLDIFHLLRLGPILNNLYLCLVHGKCTC